MISISDGYARAKVQFYYAGIGQLAVGDIQLLKSSTDKPASSIMDFTIFG
jgi:hypothetical protein